MKKNITILFCLIQAFNIWADVDTTAPMLNSIEINTTPIIAGESVTFTLNVTDDISGVNYIMIKLKNPNGKQEETISGLTTSSSSTSWSQSESGNYSKTIIFNEYAVSGEWYVSSVYIKDNADNVLSQYSSSGDIFKFQVTGQNADETPPSLNQISITNETITPGDAVTFNVDVVDGVSGVDYIMIKIKNPQGEQEESISGFTSSSTGWSKLDNGSYSKTITFNEYAASGKWYVSSVYITDKADNVLSQNSISGVIFEFDVTSLNADETAPSLNQISLTNNTVSPGENVTFIVDVTDEGSGVNYIMIKIKNPQGEQEETISGLTSSSSATGWTELDNGNYTKTITFNEFAVTGEWYVSSVYITDSADNVLNQNNNSGDIFKFNVIDYATSLNNHSKKEEFKLVILQNNTYRIISSSKIKNVRVYDFSGKSLPIVFSGNTLSVNSDNYGFLLVVQTEYGIQTKKIIKQE